MMEVLIIVLVIASPWIFLRVWDGICYLIGFVVGAAISLVRHLFGFGSSPARDEGLLGSGKAGGC